MTTNIYGTVGTTKKWTSSGGDYTFDFSNGAAGKATATGRLGARGDLGAILASGPSARAMLYRYYGKAKTGGSATGLVVGNTMDMYLAGWNDDGTPANADGNVGASDAEYNTAALLRNLIRLKPIVLDTTSTATQFGARSGLILLPYRYVSPVWWNGTGGTLSTTGTDFEFGLTPVNWQSQ
jgi:hypothetical protein